MRLFCNHKYGNVDDKGYQYCEICGNSRCVGLPNPPKCSHKWNIINTLESSNRFTMAGRFNAIIYIQKCERCGKLKNFSSNN